MRTEPLRIAFAALLIFPGCSRKVERQDPKSALVTAESVCASNQFRRCAELLKVGLRSRPNDPEIHYRLGLALRDSHDIEGAKDELYRAHKLEPDYRDSLLRLAELMVKSASLQDVQWSGEHAERVLAQKSDAPSRADAYFTLGVGKLRLGDTEGGMADFQKALDAVPSHTPSAINLAVLEWMSGSPAQAESVIRKIAAISPQPEARAAAGEFFRLQGKNLESEREFRKVLETEPANQSALLNLGGILMTWGRIGEAEQFYARTAQLPNYRHIHAVFLYQTGKASEAVAELRGLLQGEPSNNQVRRCLEAMLLASNQYREALALADQVLAKHPCDAPARLLAGEAWLALQDSSESSAALDKAEGCNARSVMTRFLRARTVAAQNKRAFSDSELREILRVDPGFTAARIALLRSFLADDRPQLAVEEINEVMRLNESTTGVHRLLPRKRNAAWDDGGGIWAAERNWALLSDGDWSHARAFIESDLARSRSAELLLQRAVAAAEAGKAEARVFLDEAVQLTPGSPAIRVARQGFQSKTPGSSWTQLVMLLAEAIRPSVSGVELLDLGGVVRSGFVLREPYPDL